MDLSTVLFRSPKFRGDVEIVKNEEGVEILYRDQGCNISLDKTSQNSFIALLEDLKTGGYEVAGLSEKHEHYAEDLSDYLIEFDRLGLLEESHYGGSPGALSGRSFYFQKLMPAIDQIQEKLGDSYLFSRIQNGEVTDRELIGYALEYFHLVNMAPGLISPSISSATNINIKKEVIKLFVEEYDHDKMMIKSLAAVGIKEESLRLRQPLASTFGSCVSLGSYARQHPLSFYCALFLFETPSSRFNEVFKTACESVGLPPEFYTPILRHSNINEEEAHGDITLNILKNIPIISEEEQFTTLIHVTSLVEQLNVQDREIVEYYSNKGNSLERVF